MEQEILQAINELAIQMNEMEARQSKEMKEMEARLNKKIEDEVKFLHKSMDILIKSNHDNLVEIELLKSAK